jgi:hypothetical protein
MAYRMAVAVAAPALGVVVAAVAMELLQLLVHLRLPPLLLLAVAMA